MSRRIVSSGAPADKYEIIAVDDNSTDASLVKLQEWESKTENMRVYHRRKAGPGGARNLGLNYAKGRYIMFVDVDDRINPSAFARLITRLIGLYSHQVIGFDCLKVDASDREVPFQQFVLLIAGIFPVPITWLVIPCAEYCGAICSIALFIETQCAFS